MSIRVDVSRHLSAISPLIYGAVDEWFDGYFDPASPYYQESADQVDSIGITNFRMGGSPTEHYHWLDPDAYEMGTTEEYAAYYAEDQRPLMSNIDHLIGFARQTSSVSIPGNTIGVNFLRGTAAEAAAWVRHTNVEKGYGVRYWEIGNELAYFPKTWLAADPDRFYFGGSYFQKAEELGASSGRAGQVLRVQYPPVESGLTIYVDGVRWERVDDIASAGTGNYYQYRQTYTPALYYRGEVLFGDGANGNVPPKGAVITADYVSGPHEGAADFIAAIKSVDPTVRVGVCGDEIDWYTKGVTHWTRRLLELDAAQADPMREFDFIAPHWHAIRRGDHPVLALHRQDNFDSGMRKLRDAIVAAYGQTKPHKVDLPIFINEWKAVHWAPPMPQQLWALLYVVDALGRLARNGVAQASITHLRNHIKSDGLLSYEHIDPAYRPNQPMPTAYALQMVARRFGGTLVESTCDSPLRVYASTIQGDSGDELCLLVVNRDDLYDFREAIQVEGLSTSGTPSGIVNIWTLSGESLTSHQRLNINGVKLDGLSLSEAERIPPLRMEGSLGSLEYTFPAHSATVMRMVSA